MTSPPLASAPTPVNGLTHTGTPRENDRRFTATRVPGRPHASSGWVRVMQEQGINLKAGAVIGAELTYALEAPDGRRIPIPAGELAEWLDDFYRPGVNKRGRPSVFVRDDVNAGMWRGNNVGTVPVHCGSWSILQSDEVVRVVPQMHTAPLAKLVFCRDEGESTIQARYLARRQNELEETKKTPAVVEFGDESNCEGPNTKIQEDQHDR